MKAAQAKNVCKEIVVKAVDHKRTRTRDPSESFQNLSVNVDLTTQNEMSICLDAALKESKDPTPSIFKDKYTAESSRALALLNRKSASIKDEEDVEKKVG